jgi:hypothetical protein
MIKRLLYLNGLAILSAILNHANVWTLIAMIWWTHRYRDVAVPNYDQVGSIAYYVVFVLRGVIQFAIPTFLFVSGVFITIATDRTQRTISWKVILSRVKYLLVPYIVWFLINALLFILEGNSYTLIRYLELFVTGGIRGPYYYVPLLIQLFLLSPFLAVHARSNWKALLTITALIQLLTQILLYLELFNIDLHFLPFDIVPIWFFPTRIFWFTLGIVVGFHLQSIKALLSRYKWQLIILTIIFFVLNTLEREFIFISNITIPAETTIGSLYAVSFIFMILALSSIKLPYTKQINDIGSKSFGLYLIHVPAQIYTARIIYHVMPWLLDYQVLFLIIIFGVGLAIPLLLMEVVRRSPARRFYRNIFG